MAALLKVTLIGLLLALVGERIVHFIYQGNLFREIEPVDLPNCQLLDGIEYGSEDIDILPSGLAFISSGLKYPEMFSFAPDRPGEIFLLDLNEEIPRPSSLRISRGFDLSSFAPHGLSIYIDKKDDAVYLFVVNHPQYKSTVEIFKFDEEEKVLVHLKTVKHSSLYNVNDIVAVGPESFYATNDRYFWDTTMRHVEHILGLRWTNVVYYSPEDVREVASGFYSANGIIMSPDRKFLYVADPMGKTITVLEKRDDWSLSPVKVLQLETIVDNVSVDPVTGDVWAGAHPNGLKLLNYNPEDPPGSEVLRIQNIHSDNPVVTTVYANNGSVLQGSTVAVLWENKLLVGTVFHKALYCHLE
ncbi:serum paraoxonase/arylesterase 2-like [Hyperolius riggenbachi]|uniref:serum paraoxonase/arylesterase 2-like n=1 Tax=Hyperolius riggenbachi TaxID=752182 RepID=UPI0035A382C0